MSTTPTRPTTTTIQPGTLLGFDHVYTLSSCCGERATGGCGQDGLVYCASCFEVCTESIMREEMVDTVHRLGREDNARGDRYAITERGMKVRIADINWARIPSPSA